MFAEREYSLSLSLSFSQLLDFKTSSICEWFLIKLNLKVLAIFFYIPISINKKQQQQQKLCKLFANF